VKIMKKEDLGKVSKKYGYPITIYMSVFVSSITKNNKIKIYRLLQEPEIIELSSPEWNKVQDCLNEIY
jgi:hypothetical protein